MLLTIRSISNIIRSSVNSSCLQLLLCILCITLHKSKSYHYTPNPRALHPNGRVPTTKQAIRKLQSIREAFEEANTNKCMNDRPPILLIDGNNIRNSFGYESVSALEMTLKLSDWSDGDTNIPSSSVSSSMDAVCLWDGGQCLHSEWVNSTLAIFSGPDGNADDVLVQCCAFLSHYYDQDIFVFSSDANLANRCKMQLTEQHKSIHIYHSVYLCLLLDPDADVVLDDLTPDWERHERRRSVDELQESIIPNERIYRSKDQAVGRNRRSRVMEDVTNWINSERPGLKTGRVTKGGSVLYRIE